MSEPKFAHQPVRDRVRAAASADTPVIDQGGAGLRAERTLTPEGTSRVSARRVSAVFAREHLWAALLVFAVVLVELWPALVAGRLLSPTTFLYLVVPWRSYAPPDIQHYFNPLL